MRQPTSAEIARFGSAIADHLKTYRAKVAHYDWPLSPKGRQAATSLGLLTAGAPRGGLSETIALRAAVAAEARRHEKAPAQLKRLARFVISDWGGLAANQDETIAEYVERFTQLDVPINSVTGHAALAVATGRSSTSLYDFDGVASWSKWLNFVWNDWALIFDARIAFALNAIHFMKKVDAPVFPVPTGRNRLLSHFDAASCAALALKSRRGDKTPASEDIQHWMASEFVLDAQAYPYYLDVMAAAHAQLWAAPTPLVHTEMLVFRCSIDELVNDFATELVKRLT